MVTSSARRTPSLFTSSVVGEVAAVAIAFLLLTSVGQTHSSPAHIHPRNTSAIDHRSPSSLPHSTNESPLLFLQQRRVHRRAVTPSNTPKIQCFSCTYIQEEDYTTGEECNDHFNPANIPEVMCPGSCHKLKRKLHQGGVMLVRGCMKTCVEKVDEHGYRHCCTSKLCNRSFSLDSVNNAVKIICSTLISLLLVARLNSFV